MSGVFTKRPGETLDFTIDLSAWLSGEPLTSYAVEVPPESDLGIEGVDLDGEVLTVWLSGGIAGQRSTLTAILRAGGRTQKECITVVIQPALSSYTESYIDFIERFAATVLAAARLGA